MASAYEKSSDYGGPEPRRGAWLIGGVLAVLVLVAFVGWAKAADFTGWADWNAPYDGDTFWLCDSGACTKIRLCGIDAPERGDTGASEATAALRRIVGDGQVQCTQVGGGTPCDGRSSPTNGDRAVAQCFASGARDVAAEMVGGGFACDWIEFSGGFYAAGDPAEACRK